MPNSGSFPVVAAAAIVFVIVVAVAAIATLTLTARGGSADVVLEGVPVEALRDSGIRLLPPTERDTATITAEEAIAAATESRTRQEATVLETVLVRLVNDRIGTGPGRLAWAVNFDPASVQAAQAFGTLGAKYCPRGAARPEYAVALVDAVTAELVFDMQRTRVPPLIADGDCPPIAPEEKDYPSPTHVRGAETTAPELRPSPIDLPPTATTPHAESSTP